MNSGINVALDECRNALDNLVAYVENQAKEEAWEWAHNLAFRAHTVAELLTKEAKETLSGR